MKAKKVKKGDTFFFEGDEFIVATTLQGKGCKGCYFRDKGALCASPLIPTCASSYNTNLIFIKII